MECKEWRALLGERLVNLIKKSIKLAELEHRFGRAVICPKQEGDPKGVSTPTMIRIFSGLCFSTTLYMVLVGSDPGHLGQPLLFYERAQTEDRKKGGSVLGNVLMFGGLTNFGKSFIDYLLREGHGVWAVRPSRKKVTADPTEEVEMFFARHALFQPIEADLEDDLSHIEFVMMLDVVDFFEEAGPTADHREVLRRLTACFEKCHALKSVIIASHIDIYGATKGFIDEKTPVMPMGKRAKHVDQVERNIVQYLLSKRGKARHLRVYLCRLPDIHQNNQADPLRETLHIQDAVKGISQLLQVEDSAGIKIIQFTSGRILGAKEDTVQYSFRKAQRLLGFSPDATLKSMEGED